MKPDLQTLTVLIDNTVRDTMKVIDKGTLGIAFIVDNTFHLKGVVTDGDVRRALLKGATLDAPVADVMNSSFVSAPDTATRNELMKCMSGKITHLPLIDENGTLVDYASFSRLVRLPVAEPELNGNEMEYVTECIATNWISSQGKFVTMFEEQFATYCGTKHAISASNGTVALHLALVSLGIGTGDEVIVPTLTFAATAAVVKHAGATPVCVDVTADTWTIDPLCVENAITPKTKAIIPVHLYGHPADMDPLMALAEKHDLYVIEDAAEAHGAEYKGKKVGSIGHAGCFSFYGNKIITTGEGGMITTNSDLIDKNARIYRDHGMSPERRYWHDVVGYNYRLTNIQAAIGVAQLERIDDILQRKNAIAEQYNTILQESGAFTLPPNAEWATPVCWLYSILLNNLPGNTARDNIIEKLRGLGVDTRPLFYPLHHMPPYISHNSFPQADAISECGITLPSALSIKEKEIEVVCDKLKFVMQ